MAITITGEIQSLVQSITSTVPTRKIILFGSHAAGNAGADSDIDLCVLTDDARRTIEILREIRKAIYHVTDHPVDVLVYKSDEFYDRASLSTTFESSILQNGMSVYE